MSAGLSSSHIKLGRSASKKLVKTAHLPDWPQDRVALLGAIEPRLVKPLTTVIIPLDDRVGSRSLAHAAEFLWAHLAVTSPS